MAKRLIDWKLVGSVLTMGKYIDAETPADELESFDIKNVYPMFDEFNDVQKYLTVYGVKQRLADKGSAEKEATEKAILAKELYIMFENGEYKAPRTNATGAKENKTIVSKAKETAGVVSLEGLLAKKTFFPDTFTEEDEVKLGEFLAMVAEHK